MQSSTSLIDWLFKFLSLVLAASWKKPRGRQFNRRLDSLMETALLHLLHSQMSLQILPVHSGSNTGKERLGSLYIFATSPRLSTFKLLRITLQKQSLQLSTQCLGSGIFLTKSLLTPGRISRRAGSLSLDRWSLHSQGRTSMKSRQTSLRLRGQ